MVPICPIWITLPFFKRSSTIIAEGKRQGSISAGFPISPFIPPSRNNSNSCALAVLSEELFIERLPHRELPAAMYTSQNLRKKGCQKQWKDTLDHLDKTGIQVDLSTYASLLRWCGNVKMLSDGIRVHNHMIRTGLERNRYLKNLLVQMYGNCGALEVACTLFDNMYQRDVFSWNFMIQAYVQQGQSKEALQLFERMQLESQSPDKFLFVSILSACESQVKSKEMHALIVGFRFESDILVGTALIKLYGKCGQVETARIIFEGLAEQDTVAWTAIIAVYSQHKLSKPALELFDKMEELGVKPDDVTLVNVLSACASQADLPEGQRVHARIVDAGLEADVSVGNGLLNMYSKCSTLEDVQKMFDNMLEWNVVSWNAIVAAYVHHGHTSYGLQVFNRMHQEGILANKVSFISIISACDCLPALAEGKRIHAYIMCCEFESDLMICNALVNMYSKCGSVESALRVFHNMPVKDVVSWNTLTAAYGQNEQGRKALQSFIQMQLEGTMPDEVSFVNILDVCASESILVEGKQIHAFIVARGFELNVFCATALINMYGKCGSLKYAQMLFDTIPVRDGVSWNAMAAAFAQDGKGKATLQTFEQMQQEGVMPDKLTFVSVISACSGCASLSKCKWIHACVVGCALDLEPSVGNSLVNMYSKCGNLDYARMVFENLPAKDLFSWNAIIAAYAQNGQGKVALQLFPSMQQAGAMPDKVTFVCVLSACSHAGLVEEGRRYFVSMQQDHGVIPVVEHFNCMINLLGRAGRLDEAENLIHNMPFQPSTVSWLTLLGACRHHVDVKRGERAAECMFRMDPKDVTPYVLLSNMYIAAGMEDKAANILQKINKKGLEPEPGHIVHEFVVEDEGLYTPNREIDLKLGQLILKWAGHTDAL